MRGICLFIVAQVHPRRRRPARRAQRGASCAGLEEKMGIHGNATCVMSYEEATGWLVGEENRGLRLMFVMMNEARLGVGMQGLAQGEAAYQAAAAFAKERLQGRSLTGPKNPRRARRSDHRPPGRAPHADGSRGRPRGGRAFLLWTALHGDLMHDSPDEAVRDSRRGDYMGLMTPVLKAFLTDRGFKICSDAMQVHGGSRLHRALSGQPVSARLPHRHDLRGDQRHPGARPGGPQAGGQRRPRGDGLLRRDRRLRRRPMTRPANSTPFIDGLAGAKAQLQEATCG